MSMGIADNGTPRERRRLVRQLRWAADSLRRDLDFTDRVLRDVGAPASGLKPAQLVDQLECLADALERREGIDLEGNPTLEAT
jgi:hypothetical protein